MSSVALQTESASRQINSLQAGRAFAAVAVVAHHATISAAAFLQPVSQPFRAVFEHGYLGVDFFFVLSGFIIYWTTHRHWSEPDWPRSYVRSRLSRIFVPYLPIGIGIALLYLALPEISTVNRDWGWLPTLTLLPTTEDTALGVAWTLRHELVFYALFLVFALTGRPLALLGGWALLCAASLPVAPVEAPLKYLLDPINAEFLFGAVAAHAVARRIAISDRLLLALSILCLASFIAAGAARSQSLLFGLALALAIIPVVRLELAGRIVIPALLVILGSASYAIYLVHDPVISILARALRSAPSILHVWPFAGAVFVTAAAAAGLAYHWAFERPALRLTKGLFLRRRLGEA